MKKALFILLLSVAAAGCHKSDAPAPAPDGDRVSVGFALGEVSASAKPASRADALVPEALAVGTTVRVLAFQRAQGAADADIAVDSYVAEATYVVAEEGFESDGVTPKRVLKACNVDAAGAVDAANTADPAEIRLRADKYDFYAFTPAAAIASPWTVSISHGVDHASSCTKDVAIAPNLSSGAPLYKQTVTLDMLVRRCAKVSFSFDRKSESSSIKKLTVKKVKLSQIAHSPSAASKLCAPLSIGANDAVFEGFPTGTVTYPDSGDPVTFDCFDEVLPKASGDYKLDLTLNFNDSSQDATPSAAISTSDAAFANVLEFVPGYHYNFKITLKGNIFTLTLQVGDWDLAPDWGAGDSELGAWPGISVVIGQWEVVEKWDTELGGSLSPVITVGGWTSNSSENWGSDVGGFPMLDPKSNGAWNSGNDSGFDGNIEIGQ